MTKPAIKIPFNSSGDLMDYYCDWMEKDVTWLDNHEFDAAMRLIDYHRGRSKVQFVLEHLVHGTRFHMFCNETFKMLKDATTISKGIIEGRWTFCKRGNNYSLKYLGPKQND